MTVHFNPRPFIPARTNPSLSSWAVRLQIRPFGGNQLRSKRKGIQSFRISIRHNRSKLVKNTIKNNHLFHNEIIKIVIKGCFQIISLNRNDYCQARVLVWSISSLKNLILSHSQTIQLWTKFIVSSWLTVQSPKLLTAGDIV